MKWIVIAAAMLTLVSPASARVVKVKELPSFTLGNWCLVPEDFEEGSGDRYYERCSLDRDLVISRKGYGTDTSCHFKSITRIGNTYLIRADCDGEGWKTTEWISATLMVNTLQWNMLKEKRRK